MNGSVHQACARCGNEEECFWTHGYIELPKGCVLLQCLDRRRREEERVGTWRTSSAGWSTSPARDRRPCTAGAELPRCVVLLPRSVRKVPHRLPDAMSPEASSPEQPAEGRRSPDRNRYVESVCDVLYQTNCASGISVRGSKRARYLANGRTTSSRRAQVICSASGIWP